VTFSMNRQIMEHLQNAKTGSNQNRNIDVLNEAEASPMAIS
jgi:hypothetical protein